jgi:hypothetical protein
MLGWQIAAKPLTRDDGAIIGEFPRKKKEEKGREKK